MSNIYITEPPSSGKVLLKTTVGDIDIELWSKETPKTCRNFVQLCLEGYYDGTLFHRIVKGFIAQGGDPNGDGTGGDSIYGEPFKDEFHSRLRFNRRGLVAMANAGKDDNGSQFFFTLASTPELQNKHTIFGKVSGPTVFNMIKLEEGIIEDERPEYPHKILKTEVLHNPFPDIEPRVVTKVEDRQEKLKVKQPGVKNFKLLSFGEEAEEDEEETTKVNTQFAGKSKSTHDLLDDPKLSSKSVIGEKEKTKTQDQISGSEEDKEIEQEEEDLEAQLASIRSKLKREEKKKPNSTYYLNKDVKDEKKRKAEEIREEIKKVKKEYQENKLEREKKDAEIMKETEQKNESYKEYKEEFYKYKEKKKDVPKKGKSREDFTLQMLSKFKNKLENAKEKYSNSENKNKDKIEMKDKEGSDEEDTSWMAHQLHFDDNDPVLAKDANTKGDDWFEIYDPRNPLTKRRREESKKLMGSSKRK